LLDCPENPKDEGFRFAELRNRDDSRSLEK
jgi:hypothetical protein